MGKKDNASKLAKAALRRQVRALAGGSPVVLETCGGVGGMYQAAWAGLSGLVVEKDRTRAHALACARPTWTVIKADAGAALAAGLGSKRVFDVIDVDTYGSPWEILKAWLTSTRARADVERIVLTDGYMSSRGIAKVCLALFPDGRKPGRLRADHYLEIVDQRVASWARPRRAQRLVTVNPTGNTKAGVSLHLYEVRA